LNLFVALLSVLVNGSETWAIKVNDNEDIGKGGYNYVEMDVWCDMGCGRLRWYGHVEC